jgi:hypothetical protein
MQPSLGNLFYSILPDSSIYGFKRYYFKTLLPAGSPPGLWGVSAIGINDHAQNKKYYSFVEYVRFDVEQSTFLQVTPYVEILGKKVNSKNVDSVAVKIGCASCKDQLYRLRMYGSMGGSSVVFEGKMTLDTITLTNLNLKGVNDGVLYATVFMLDSSSALIGTGKATYTKDVQPPKSSIIQANISNIGKSNLDSLIVDMKVGELNCAYNVVLTQKSIVKNSIDNSKTSIIKSFAIAPNAVNVGYAVSYTGQLTDSIFKVNNISLSTFQDGIIELKIIVLDSLGNETTPVNSTIYKDTKDPIIQINKIATAALKATYKVESNEYLANNLVKDNLSIASGVIDSVVKISNLSYNVYLTRICNDSVILNIKPGVLLDTVGNKNILTTLSVVEQLIPKALAVLNLAYCNNEVVDTIKVTPAPNNTALWYNAASGGTSSTISPKPITTSVGNTSYYVSQIASATGCESVRSKIEVLIKPIPTAPNLSRDIDNYLVSTSPTGNTWYKDGVVITDTSQKIKPTIAGNYTAKTTQNGCTSITSAAYYFLVTDIYNLSASEFIQLAPNPFVNQLNLDFAVRGYQKLNMDVYAMSTGLKIISKEGLYAGVPLFLSQLLPGTYLIKISSSDQKISYQFKMVKL